MKRKRRTSGALPGGNGISIASFFRTLPQPAPVVVPRTQLQLGHAAASPNLPRAPSTHASSNLGDCTKREGSTKPASGGSTSPPKVPKRTNELTLSPRNTSGNLKPPPPRKKSKRSFQPAWRIGRPWLKPSDDSAAMTCTLCTKHATLVKSKAVKSQLSWATQGVTRLKKDGVESHERSAMHRKAVAIEFQAESLESSGGWPAQVVKMLGERERFVKRKMLPILWLAKECEPLSKVPSLNDLIRSTLDAVGGLDSNSSDAAMESSYSSYELLEALAECVSNNTLRGVREALRKGRFIALLLDETTDTGNTAQLAVRVRYVLNGHLSTDFLTCLQLGTSHTGRVIRDTVLKHLRTLEISPHVCHIGSDGGAQFMGKHNGFNKLWVDAHPHTLTNWCYSHKQALPLKHAILKTEYLQRKVEPILGAMARYFRFSAVRWQRYKELVEFYDDYAHKIPEPFFVRWLSYGRTVTVILDSYKYLVLDFQEESEQERTKKEQTSTAVLRALKTRDFLCALLMIADACVELDVLCKVLQQREIDFATAHRSIEHTISMLDSLKDNPGPEFHGVDHRISELEEQTGVTFTRLKTDAGFRKRVYTPFYERLVTELRTRLQEPKFFEHAASFQPATFPNSSGAIASHGEDAIDYFMKKLGAETCGSTELPAQFDAAELKIQFRRIKVATLNSDTLKSCTTLAHFTQTLAKDTILGPEIGEFLRLFDYVLTIPISNAEIERDFSKLKLIKSRLRSKLDAKHLNELMVLATNSQTLRSFDFKTAISIFFSKKQRRV